MALGKFDWKSLPKDTTIRILDVPEDDGVFWMAKPKTWKLTLPESADLMVQEGYWYRVSDEVTDWMDINLKGPGFLGSKALIHRNVCRDTHVVTYNCSLYSERDFIMFKLRFQ